MDNSDNGRAPDRRQRKSRAALHQGLLGLIPTKAYDAITIEDITAAADVARPTFYAHYRDKSALLDEAVTELLKDVAEQVNALAAPPESNVYTGAAVIAVFRHAEERRDLYRLLLRGEAGGSARDRLIAAFESVAGIVFARTVAEPRRKPRVPLAGTTKAYVGAALLTLESWLDTDDRPDATRVVADLIRGQIGGLEWSLGYAPGELRFEHR